MGHIDPARWGEDGEDEMCLSLDKFASRTKPQRGGAGKDGGKNGKDGTKKDTKTKKD